MKNRQDGENTSKTSVKRIKKIMKRRQSFPRVT